MELSFGQRVDPENNLVELWLTHGALDEIKKMDLSDKIVWMWGAGMGDCWLSKRCKELHIVERNPDWVEAGRTTSVANGCVNITYYYRPCNEGSGAQDMYCELPDGLQIDVMINDDAYRTEVCQVAVDYFSKRDIGILICDNYWQDFVWKSPKAIELLQPFPKKIYTQPDHVDHEGDGWKTAIVYISKYGMQFEQE